MSDKNEGTAFDSMIGGGVPEGAPQGEGEDGGVEEQTSSFSLANFSTQVDFDSSDIKIPRIRLAQGLTAEVQDGTAKPGQWLFTGYEPLEELTVVPLMFSRNRALRDDAGTVMCRSSDSYTGVGSPGGECARCPMNKWTEGPKGEKNLPPQCVFSYVYICYVVEHMAIGVIDFRRTSLGAGKTLNTFCAQRGIGNFAVKLRNSKQSGKRGSFYQIVVQPTTVEPLVIQNAKAMLGH